MTSSERSRRLQMFVTALAAAATLGSCADSVPLEGLQCPCADGYVCCHGTNQCMRAGASCGSDAGGEGAAIDAPMSLADASATIASDAAGDVMTPACAMPERGGSYCAALPELTADPKLDGVPECGLALQWITPKVWTGLERETPSERFARYAAAWTPKGLYLYVEVFASRRAPEHQGDKYHCGDAIEVFVDDDGMFGDPPGYMQQGTRQLIFPAPDTGDGTFGGRPWKWTAGRPDSEWLGAYATVGRGDGYAMEVVISGGDLAVSRWTPAAGGHMGFDVAVDVSPPVAYERTDADYCNRLGQFSMNGAPTPIEINGYGPCRVPWCNVGAFCTPELTADGVPHVDAAVPVVDAATPDAGARLDASLAPDASANVDAQVDQRGDDAAP